MDNTFYNPNMASNLGYNTQTGSTGAPSFSSTQGTELPMEQSYVENILRMNTGKIANFYMTFPNAGDWQDKMFTGVIEQAARDHIVISDPKTGKWYILLMIYLDWLS